jgi:hypothetical protein
MPQLVNFAGSLQRQVFVLQAALTLPSSYVEVEGQMRNLALLKRHRDGQT